MRKLREWISVQEAKNPGKMILVAILLFNVFFFFVSALIISNFSLQGTEKMSFIEAAFCTVTMILDAGCIQFVIEDIGTAGVAVAIICLAIIFIGMISFTGAVIGYITNYISRFIESSNAGVRRLRISDHTVILNWNTRASEIINDMLYCNSKQKIIVLVNSRKTEIEKEIFERLEDTVSRENAVLYSRTADLGFFRRRMTRILHRFKNNLTVVVREGDVFSSKQLHDISLEHAKTVIILGNDINNSVCKYEQRDKLDEREAGNSQTVKTLMQVSDITSAEYSDDDQKIIVEITDDWTFDLVKKIIRCKQVDGKCNIVPVAVNKILGQILSQFSLMPELNLAYRELFSNKGATFYADQTGLSDDRELIKGSLANNRHSIPLTVMKYKDGKSYAYYSSASQKDIDRCDNTNSSDYSVDINQNYWIEHKNIIILGHNSRTRDIMRGFESFVGEWGYDENNGEDILHIIVVDEEKQLEKINYYKEYPFVIDTVCASIYEENQKELIRGIIDRFSAENKEDTSVLILSDDSAPSEDTDAQALANLVYVQDIIKDKLEENSNFDIESIDVIVEIIDPKHHDIVNSYSINNVTTFNVNNVVISNRYISKMITQIGEKDILFDFYTDILTYDEEGVESYESKEIYAKKVSRFFNTIPAPCTAEQFIRALYNKSTDPSIPPEKQNPTIALGYVKPGGRMVLFEGDQSSIKVELEEKDKIIVFSNH